MLDSAQPNAFATGRNPQNAAVAASRGLLERLSAEEVAGVMAHELAHIEHRDTLTMTLTATIAGAISMLGNFAFFMGGQRSSSEDSHGVGAIGGLIALIIAPLLQCSYKWLLAVRVNMLRIVGELKYVVILYGWLRHCVKLLMGGMGFTMKKQSIIQQPRIYLLSILSGKGADSLFFNTSCNGKSYCCSL